MDAINNYFSKASRTARLGRVGLIPPITAKIWQRLGLGDYVYRCLFDAVERPQYAWGVFGAAFLARSLGMDRCTVVEFGVASGSGLRALEYHAREVGRRFGISVQVIGYDTGDGMPPPTDPRDFPYWFTQGIFAMDEGKLRKALCEAKLVLGDIRETASQDFGFADSPVGLLSIDVDTYTAAAAALNILKSHPQEAFLPRVLIYCDDVMGNWNVPIDDWTGQLAAIEDFNSSSDSIKVGKIHGIQWSRAIPSIWNEKYYVANFFDHPLFGVDCRSVTGASNLL